MRETEHVEEQKQNEALADVVSEIRRANMSRELLYGFVFLLVVHVFAILWLLPYGARTGSFFVWISLGGIGTLAVWFACAARPLVQRITRVGIAIAIAATVCGGTLSYLTLPQQRSQTSRRTFQWSNRVRASGADSTQQIMMCWMFGATAGAFAVHWFFGMQLVPPDCESQRKPLSLRSIFLLTIFAALMSLYIRGPNWQNRISYITNGVTLGLVASAIAFGIFSTRKFTTRIAVPLAVVTLIVASDLFVGALTSMWRGNFLDRLSYVVVFAVSLGVSPALSFLLLKQLGYRMHMQRRSSLAS